MKTLVKGRDYSDGNCAKEDIWTSSCSKNNFPVLHCVLNFVKNLIASTE